MQRKPLGHAGTNGYQPSCYLPDAASAAGDYRRSSGPGGRELASMVPL
jgi:hypothetical protein